VVRRVALVVWWLGALCLVVGFAGMFVAERNHWLMLAMGAMFTIPCWAVAFILAGSFLKPPKLDP
jgi:hypothetical protein